MLASTTGSCPLWWGRSAQLSRAFYGRANLQGIANYMWWFLLLLKSFLNIPFTVLLTKYIRGVTMYFLVTLPQWYNVRCESEYIYARRAPPSMSMRKVQTFQERPRAFRSSTSTQLYPCGTAGALGRCFQNGLELLLLVILTELRRLHCGQQAFGGKPPHCLHLRRARCSAQPVFLAMLVLPLFPLLLL